MPKQATGACMQRGVRIAADADGRRVVLVLALHATMLSAVSASAQPAAGAAFIGNSALVLAGGVGAKRPGTVLLKNSCFPKMLAAGWSVGMGDGGTLRLRGGSLLDRCLPVSLQRQPQTRTCFTSANLVGALAGGSSTHAASPAARTPRVVFILGGPGAGKGTQCSKITQEYHRVRHLSAGDLLRAERDSGSEQGDMINSYMKEGKIIPVKVTAGLLKQAIERERAQCDVFLIDGFPRNYDNLRGWNEIVGDSVQVEFMILMECSESVMLERLLVRGAGSGRVDDNAETIQKRFAVYKKETLPVVTYFEEQARLQRISADQTVDTVFADIEKVFSPVAMRKSRVRRLAEKSRGFVQRLLRLA